MLPSIHGSKRDSDLLCQFLLRQAKGTPQDSDLCGVHPPRPLFNIISNGARTGDEGKTGRQGSAGQIRKQTRTFGIVGDGPNRHKLRAAIDTDKRVHFTNAAQDGADACAGFKADVGKIGKE